MFTRSQGSSGRRPPCEVWTPLARNLNPATGCSLVWQPNVGLIDPDYHHPQLLELCELNQKRWESLTIPNQAPSGGFWGAKERSEATRGPPPERIKKSPEGPHSKGILRSSITPNFGLLAFGLLKKTNPQRSWGASITPNFEGLGFPRGSKSKRACEVERLGLNRKKMARWYRRYRRSSYRRTGKHWSPTTQVVNTATSSGSQKSLPIAFNHGGTSGEQLPDRTDRRVKYFRLNIVFESSVTVLWALVYVPDGLPIGRLNVAGSQADSVPGALYEPQQFIIASGVYTSQGSSGASAPCESGRP